MYIYYLLNYRLINSNVSIYRYRSRIVCSRVVTGCCSLRSRSSRLTAYCFSCGREFRYWRVPTISAAISLVFLFKCPASKRVENGTVVARGKKGGKILSIRCVIDWQRILRIYCLNAKKIELFWERHFCGDTVIDDKFETPRYRYCDYLYRCHLFY